MTNHGEGKDNLTAHTTRRIKSYVIARGRRLDITASKFTSLLLDWWLAQGAPGVSPADIDRKPFLRWDPDWPWETHPEGPEAAPAVALLRKKSPHRS